MSSEYVGTIHLDSNVIEPLQQTTNTLASFKTTLSSPCDYGSEDFEVGLVNMTYSNSWYNISPGQFLAITDTISSEIKQVTQIPEGSYESAEAILEMINNTIKKSNEPHNSHVINIHHKYLEFNDWNVMDVTPHECSGIKCLMNGLFGFSNEDDASDHPALRVDIGFPKLELAVESGMVKVVDGYLMFFFDEKFEDLPHRRKHLLPLFSREVAEMLGMPIFLGRSGSDRYYMRTRQLWHLPRTSLDL